MSFTNWLIFAAILLILELFSNTLVAAFFALSALILAAITYFNPNFQVSLQFSIFTIVGIISSIIILIKNKHKKANDNLSERERLLFDQIATIIEKQRVAVGDTSYPYFSLDNNDLQIGDKVKIVAIKDGRVEIAKI